MLHDFRPLKVAILVALLSSCASTSLSSYTDPAFTNATFDSVAIWADTKDLEWRRDLETNMQELVVTTTGAKAMRVLDIAPPTRDYNVAEVFKLMRGVGVAAVVVIAFTETGVTQSVSGNQYGVYTTEAPWAAGAVDMYEVESGAKVWTGTTKTEGDAFTTWKGIRNSQGSKVIAELLTSGLLPPPHEK